MKKVLPHIALIFCFLLFIVVAVAQSTITEKQNETNSAVAKILYKPSDEQPSPGAMYPRVICLKHNTGKKEILLATFEHYVRDEPSFPIYRSEDGGKTWELFSKVTDTKNGYGMRYQPVLYELPKKIGDMPAGTILCSGSSIPKDMSSTELLLYKSIDGGKTWVYVSSVIKGGRARYEVKGKETPVWEPFLDIDKKGRLICYYSDEAFKGEGFNQLLAHKISEDGKTWGKAIFDVAIPDSVTRPGMAVTAKLPNGKYIMVYEVVGMKGIPVYYRFSDDGENWGDYKNLGIRLLDTSNGFFPSGTPYVVWSPKGGKNGILVVTAKGVDKNGKKVGDGYFINRNLGEGSWTYKPGKIKYEAAARHSGGYSQSMALIDNGNKMLLVVPVPEKGNTATLYYTEENIID